MYTNMLLITLLKSWWMWDVIYLSKAQRFPIQQETASKPISVYNRHHIPHTPTLSVWSYISQLEIQSSNINELPLNCSTKYFNVNKSSYISFVALIKWYGLLVLAVSKYRRLRNARPAGNARVQNVKLPHNDCYCFKVTF